MNLIKIKCYATLLAYLVVLVNGKHIGDKFDLIIKVSESEDGIVIKREVESSIPEDQMTDKDRNMVFENTTDVVAESNEAEENDLNKEKVEIEGSFRKKTYRPQPKRMVNNAHLRFKEIGIYSDGKYMKQIVPDYLIYGARANIETEPPPSTEENSKSFNIGSILLEKSTSEQNEKNLTETAIQNPQIYGDTSMFLIER